MEISQIFFLTRYYLANAIKSKIGKRLVKVDDMAARWDILHAENTGHDAWLVVGNGPSLNVDDLESLAHIPAVASNKITLLYGKTKWRPKLYTIADPLLIFKTESSHFENIKLTLLPHSIFYMARASNKLAWKMKTTYEGEKWFEISKNIPDPVVNGFITTHSVTSVNIQLAMWLGAKTIYVIGCDHNYSEAKHGNVKKLVHEESSSHFDSEYRKKGEIVNNAPIDLMERGYDLIRKIADYHGVRIINITRRTALKSFECSTVEDAIAETTL